MDSIRRAFGRSSKSSEKMEDVKAEVRPVSPEKENSPNTSEDDIFSDMVINSASLAHSVLSGQNINDIQGLDVSIPCHVKDEANDDDDDDDDAPSAFGFMNLGQKDDDVESDSCATISLSASQENSKISVNKELAPSSDCKDVQSDLGSIKSGTTLVDQERNSLSNFSFIREDIPSVPTVPAAKSHDNIHSPPKPRNTRKTRSRSSKPGFANISTELPKISSSDISLEENSKSIETTTSDSCDTDIHEPLTTHHNIVEGSEDNEHLEKIDDIIEHKEKSKKCGSKTIDESIDRITSNETKRDLNTVCDLSSLDDTNMDSDKCTASDKNEEGIDSIHINQEGLEVNANENNIIVEAVRKDIDNGQITRIVLPNTKSSEYEDLDRDISEGEGNNTSTFDVHEELSTEQVCEEACPVQANDSEEHVINESDPYNIEITEEEKVLLKLERLQMQEQSFVKERSESMTVQKELIKQWKCDHLSEGDIQVKITELRRLQLKLESKEDYDEAAEINQTILELTDKCSNYKYQYPLLDENFLKLINDYGNLCTYHNHEYEAMLKENEDIMGWFKRKNDEDELNEEKKLGDMTLLLKERKLKIERHLSHTSLDKEHLLKNKAVLSEEINKQTKELDKEKEELIEKRAIIQVDIEELIRKLTQLQQEENGLTTLIVDIESKIQNIVDDFQPRIDEISKEEEAVEQKEMNLTTKLDDIAGEEKRIKSRNMDILNQREKTQEINSKIASSIEDIQRQRECNEKEIFSFQDSLDFKGLEFDADKDYARSKEELEELQAKLKDTTNKVLANEGKEKRLQRSMNDLEAQLAELQKLKQVHVKERKYKDAKVTSDEIKTLTSKGENISCDAVKLCESIKLQKNEIQNLNIEISQAEEKFKEKEFLHDKRITENLKKMNVAINSLLSRHHESWTVGILELTLFNNNSIIHDLTKKHRLLSNEGVEEGVDVVDVAVVKEKLVELESALEIAVTEEDWERAEEINASIEENKKLIENTM